MSWLRRIPGAVLLLTLTLAALWLRHSTSPALAIAGALDGARLYRLDLQDERIGRFESRTTRHDGVVEFASQLDAAMPGGEPFSVAQQFEFAVTPPHPLLRASHHSSNGPRSETVTLQRDGDGYIAQVQRGGVHEVQRLTWQYALTDHLGLELWLRSARPHTDERLRVRSIDFGRLEPIASTYTVVDVRSDGSYVLASATPLENKLVLLNAQLVPQALSLAGLFTLTLAPEHARLEPNRSRSHADYTRVELKQQIPRHNDVRRLVMTVNHVTADALTPLPGLQVQRTLRGWELISDSDRVASVIPDAELQRHEELSQALPENDSRLLALLEDALRGARDTLDPLVALNQFVHGYLTYDESSHSLGVADTLALRRGDCTEYADLLTALARSAGYRARTVTGLVYSNENGPAFFLHAWTEVAVNGHWKGFDPTWNQARLDATHIPFPDSDVGYLRAYAALPTMRFEVREIEYF